MTEVFRVENAEFVGPYALGIPGMNAMGCKHQPAPWNTGLGLIEPGELSGFESMRQLLAWFNTHEDLDNLEHGGMRVVVIDVVCGFIRNGREHLVFRENLAIGPFERELIPWDEVHYQLETKLGILQL